MPSIDKSAMLASANSFFNKKALNQDPNISNRFDSSCASNTLQKSKSRKMTVLGGQNMRAQSVRDISSIRNGLGMSAEFEDLDYSPFGNDN